jgi:sulfur-oxidizing protein SoxA
MRAALLGCTVLFAAYAYALEAPIPRSELKLGSEFTSAEIRAMQADDFGNPGMLWVARGERLWREAAPDRARAATATL